MNDLPERMISVERWQAAMLAKATEYDHEHTSRKYTWQQLIGARISKVRYRIACLVIGFDLDQWREDW